MQKFMQRLSFHWIYVYIQAAFLSTSILMNWKKNSVKVEYETKLQN